MKKYILLALLMPSLAFAVQWTIVKRGSTLMLEDMQNDKLFYSLTYSGNAKILMMISKYSPLEIIEYDAGDVGTSTIINTTRRVIYNTKTKKFIGDYVYKRKVTSSQSPVSIESPVWKFDTVKREIEIRDNEDGEVTVKVLKY